MQVLIVDDTRLARKELRQLLAAHPDVAVVGEAEDVDEAVEQVARLAPDLLLLDIQMPGGSGFDVLDRVERVPAVVFTTAYDDHALHAFQVNALDYLLKPIEPERLARALARVRALQDERAAAARARGVLRADDPLFVREGERCWFVTPSEITRIVVDGNYARVHFRGQRVLLQRSLSALEARLDPGLFFRANRNALVNLRRIAAIDPWVNEGYRLRLDDGGEVDVSRRQARELRERLSF